MFIPCFYIYIWFSDPPAYSLAEAPVPHTVTGQAEQVNNLPHTPDLPPQYDQLSIRTEAAERGALKKDNSS